MLEPPQAHLRLGRQLCGVRRRYLHVPAVLGSPFLIRLQIRRDDGRPVPGLSGAPAHPAARPHLGAAARPTESRAGVTMQLFGAIADGHLLPTHRTEHSELPPGARNHAEAVDISHLFRNLTEKEREV